MQILFISYYIVLWQVHIILSDWKMGRIIIISAMHGVGIRAGCWPDVDLTVSSVSRKMHKLQWLYKSHWSSPVLGMPCPESGRRCVWYSINLIIPIIVSYSPRGRSSSYLFKETLNRYLKKTVVNWRPLFRPITKYYINTCIAIIPGVISCNLLHQHANIKPSDG